MSIEGFLSDFSLPEIFQFIEQGHKTGLLTLRSIPESQGMPPSFHYIWVSKGDIVTAANQLNHQGLILLIDHYPWVSNRVVTKLAQFCPSDQPLGLYLKKQGALQIEQLEHLFQIQIVQQVCPIFQLKEAQFQFEQKASIPRLEMTGLSVPAGFIKIMLQNLIWLEKLFAARRRRSERSEFSSQSENFCNQLRLILDIAFFHSLNFSLFNTKTSFNKLSQVWDLCDFPYDLPKSIKEQEMCCTGK